MAMLHPGVPVRSLELVEAESRDHRATAAVRASS